MKNDVRGFCQPGVPISLLNEFPPVMSSQWKAFMLNNNHNQSIKGVMASEFDIFSVEVLGHGLGKQPGVCEGKQKSQGFHTFFAVLG